MTLGLREMADIILRDIYIILGDNDYLSMDKIYKQERYSDSGNKVHRAMDYLEDSGYITGERAEDGIFYYVSLTSKGILYCEEKGWDKVNITENEIKVTDINISPLDLREISIRLLEVLSNLHEKEPYASGIGFDKILNSEELKNFKEKLKDAALLLKEDGYVECRFSATITTFLQSL